MEARTIRERRLAKGKSLDRREIDVLPAFLSPPLAERGNPHTRYQVQMQASSSPAARPILWQTKQPKVARLRGSLDFAESILAASKGAGTNVVADRRCPRVGL
jgi:hypothetical protein